LLNKTGYQEIQFPGFEVSKQSRDKAMAAIAVSVFVYPEKRHLSTLGAGGQLLRGEVQNKNKLHKRNSRYG